MLAGPRDPAAGPQQADSSIWPGGRIRRLKSLAAPSDAVERAINLMNLNFFALDLSS